MYFKPVEIRKIAKDVKAGKVGIFPFDTIWGITGLMDIEVIDRINHLKQRRVLKPLIVLVRDIKECMRYAYIPSFAAALVEKYWPGEVTIILKKKRNLPDYVTNGLDTVGLRVPSFWPLNLLLEEVGQPIVSTSVNVTDMGYSLNFDDMPSKILGKVDFVYTGFLPVLGHPSAVIDCSQDKPVILRKSDKIVSSYDIY